jgi:uncharacterized membrane protein YtjA (UPF0391 family)
LLFLRQPPGRFGSGDALVVDGALLPELRTSVRNIPYLKDFRPMLRFALVFAILALIAGVLGFGGLAGDFAYFAKILLFVFLVLFVVSLLFGSRAGPVV